MCVHVCVCVCARVCASEREKESWCGVCCNPQAIVVPAMLHSVVISYLSDICHQMTDPTSLRRKKERERERKKKMSLLLRFGIKKTFQLLIGEKKRSNRNLRSEKKFQFFLNEKSFFPDFLERNRECRSGSGDTNFVFSVPKFRKTFPLSPVDDFKESCFGIFFKPKQLISDFKEQWCHNVSSKKRSIKGTEAEKNRIDN